MKREMKVSLFCLCLLLASSLACSQEYFPRATEVPTSPPTASPTAPPAAVATEPPLAEPAAPALHSFTHLSCIVTEYTDRSCSCGVSDGIIEIKGDTVVIVYAQLVPMTFERQEGTTSVYTYSSRWGESNLSEHTLTLTANGFVLLTEIYDTNADVLLCTIDKIGTYIE